MSEATDDFWSIRNQYDVEVGVVSVRSGNGVEPDDPSLTARQISDPDTLARLRSEAETRTR